MMAYDIEGQAKRAREAGRALAVLDTSTKDRALLKMAEALTEHAGEILEANAADVRRAEEKGLPGPVIYRLRLDRRKLEGMVEGLHQVARLPDPVGEVISMWKRPNGLQIGRVRVPLGVVGIIYEARPNVTTDAAGLCLKTGNAVILRGGSEALGSNRAIVEAISRAAYRAGIPEGAIQLVTDPDREIARRMMRLNRYIDVLIPRGGAQLIQTVMENSTVPVIETGVGNCHIYVDDQADLAMADRIVYNAKTSNPGVCNAVETVLVHRGVAAEFLPMMERTLAAAGVEIRGCKETRAILPGVKAAAEEDWYTEYLDLILAVKVVGGLEEAIEHINRYGTRHSEAIITENYTRARRFLEAVDAAAVYVNASTRFTDGYEYGFGAEIGISTQKLHARGPMGLEELTTTKFIIYGSGQVRL